MPGFLDFLGVFPDEDVLIAVYRLPFMLISHPGLAISPWYRLVFGFCSKFLEEQPPLFLCVSIYALYFHFILPYFVCLFVLFYFIISTEV